MSHGGTPEEQAALDQRIREKLSEIRYPIMVMSGKGGVGKSTVAVNLAVALAERGNRVGIMDVDIHGPNVPKMLGIEGRLIEGGENRIEPVHLGPNLSVASLGLIGQDPDQAIVWRGPMKIALIRQFIGDVAWGPLDYLIIDTPPGTGDESLTVAQTIVNLAGAVVVTTPQDVSILDSRKSLNFAEKLKIHVLGIVENMSGFVCPCCGTITSIFSEGGGKHAADSLGIPFLGSIPLDPAVVTAGDKGNPLLSTKTTSPAHEALNKVVDLIVAGIAAREAEGGYERERKRLSPEFRPEQ